MRVLVVTSMYPAPSRPSLGGFVRDQVEALRAIEGLEVELFAFAPGGTSRFARAAVRLRRAHGRDRFDLVHAHYGLSGWVALALGHRAPILVTFHGTDLAHRIVGPLSRGLVRRIDVAAPVSARLARAGLPGSADVRPTPVLPCGVNLDRFGPRDRGEARARLGLDPDGRYLLFPADPGRPEKRHDRALDLARAAGAELLTYGGRPSEEVPDLINAANAVVAPSDREGFGLAPLEALACDVAVLSTDVGIAPLALRDVAGTLCGPYDRAAWLATAAAHLDAPDSRVAGRRRAALFERRRMAERVFEAYRDVAGESAVRSAPGDR